MKKIGFIDHFIDEWHANNYPQFIADATGGEYKICYAYAETEPEGKMTTDEWCAKFGAERCDSIEELCEKSDVIIVASPDNPERHWDLCQIPLRSGKRVYVDKTFSLHKEEAARLMKLAEDNNTPVCSSSALRFSAELEGIDRDGICFISSRGPGNFDTYAIHQIEPICMLMGSKVKRMMSVGAGKYESMVIEFENDRRVVMTHYGWTGVDFSMNINYEDGRTVVVPQMSDYFPRFIKAMCNYFDTGVVLAAHDETIAIMGIIEAGNKALANPGVWVEV